MPAEWIMFYALLALPGAEAAAETAPPAELLEFLGSWETSKGEPVDPTQFADATLLTDKPSEDPRHEKHDHYE